MRSKIIDAFQMDTAEGYKVVDVFRKHLHFLHEVELHNKLQAEIVEMGNNLKVLKGLVENGTSIKDVDYFTKFLNLLPGVDPLNNIHRWFITGVCITTTVILAGCFVYFLASSFSSTLKPIELLARNDEVIVGQLNISQSSANADIVVTNSASSLSSVEFVSNMQRLTNLERNLTLAVSGMETANKLLTLNIESIGADLLALTLAVQQLGIANTSTNGAVSSLKTDTVKAINILNQNMETLQSETSRLSRAFTHLINQANIISSSSTTGTGSVVSRPPGISR